MQFIFILIGLNFGIKITNEIEQEQIESYSNQLEINSNQNDLCKVL